VAAQGVVEHLDVIEHVLPGGFARGIGLPFDPPMLSQLEEALVHSIVVAITLAGHTADETIRLQKRSPVLAGELAP
jgi:hypothetical protein